MTTQLTTPAAATAWRPDVNVLDAADVLPDALILSHSTISAAIQGDAPALRVAFVADDDAEFVDEGAEIPEGDPGLNEAVIYTRKFAQLIRLSREQYAQNATPEQLARSVGRAMTRKADLAFLAQSAPTAPATAPAPGLVNVTGLVSKTGVATDLDALIDLEATVRANGASPTAWIMAPDCLAALRKFKTGSQDNTSLLGAGTEQADLMLLSVPVVVNAQMPTLTGLLIDRAQIVSAVSPLEVAVSDQSYFSSDGIGIRATMRTGHAVPRPDRLGVFTVAAD